MQYKLSPYGPVKVYMVSFEPSLWLTPTSYDCLIFYPVHHVKISILTLHLGQQVKPIVMSRNTEIDNDDKLNMYFYSTDSISTLNSPTPRVSFSLLPGQRSKPHQALSGSPMVDTISHSFLMSSFKDGNEANQS